MPEPEAEPVCVFAVVPDAFGWTVVPVADLADRLADGEGLEDALTNAGIDSGIKDPDTSIFQRVRELNLTGDLTSYRTA